MSTKFIETSEKLKAKLAEIAKKVESGGKLRVGFLEGSTETKGGEVVSIPMIAAIQEFGAPKVGIPPRPFFRNCIKENSDKWGDAVAKALIATGYDGQQALKIVGAGIQAQLKQSITDTNSPPLSPVTLMLRMMRSQGGPNFVVTGRTVAEARQRVENGETASGVSTKPLIDSGQMQQAVDFEVVGK